MTTIEEAVQVVETINLKDAHPEVRDILETVRGRTEVVTEVTRDIRGLARLKTARRKEGEEKIIVESGFNVNVTGEGRVSGSRVYRGEERVVYDPKDTKRILYIIPASREYPELDKFLRERVI